MDERSIGMLVEEVFECADWYGYVSSGSRIAELFALGWVSGVHQLDREEVEQVRRALNVELMRRDQEQVAKHLIESTIRNVN